MVAPIVAQMAAQRAGKALSGDIWTRTTTREVGKGKDKRLVESTVRVNTGTALVGAGTLAVLAIGAGTTMFLMGLKPKPVTRTVNYGKWVWPDGTDASTVHIAAAAGAAPSRDSKYTEQVVDYIKPGYWDNSFWNGYICHTDGSELNQTDDTAVAKWLQLHRYHDYEMTYERVYIEPLTVWKTVAVPEYATWTVTETKDKLGFDITERPTLAEGITGAFGAAASVPIDIALAPVAAAQDAIQDFKEWLGLP